MGPKWASFSAVCQNYPTDSYQDSCQTGAQMTDWPAGQVSKIQSNNYISMSDYGLTGSSNLDARQDQVKNQMNSFSYGSRCCTNGMQQQNCSFASPQSVSNVASLYTNNSACSNIMRSHSHNNIEHLMSSQHQQEESQMISNECPVYQPIQQHHESQRMDGLGPVQASYGQSPGTVSLGQRFYRNNVSLRSQQGSTSPLDSPSNLTSPHVSEENSPVSSTTAEAELGKNQLVAQVQANHHIQQARPVLFEGLISEENIASQSLSSNQLEQTISSVGIDPPGS